jgi:hypothetical protein
MSPHVVTLDNAPGSEHRVYRLNNDGDVIGTVAVTAVGSMPAASVTSLRMLDLSSWIPKGRSIEINVISECSILTLARNEAIQRMKGDWLMFIDDDMVFGSDAVQRLVAARDEHDLDMVGGLCFRRSAPYQPTLYMREQPDAGAYNYLERWESDIVEVDATGMAFMLIHKRVFEKIKDTPMPSYEDRMRIGPPNFFRWEGILGEDLRFCQEAKAAGCRIWVDTRVEIGHVSEKVIGHRDFLAELAVRPDEVVAERQRINQQMGFPTVTPDEALAALRT